MDCCLRFLLSLRAALAKILNLRACYNIHVGGVLCVKQVAHVPRLIQQDSRAWQQGRAREQRETMSDMILGASHGFALIYIILAYFSANS